MSRRILLADDSVTIQKVIDLTFSDQEYEVVAVSDGTAALSTLAEMRPDLVLADVHMPGASGFDVCRRAKELYPGLPVVLLVGTFEPFEESEAKAAGADRSLKKPFDSQELVRLANELMASAPSVPSSAFETFTSPGSSSSFGVAAPLMPEEPVIEGEAELAVADLDTWDRLEIGGSEPELAEEGLAEPVWGNIEDAFAVVDSDRRDVDPLDETATLEMAPTAFDLAEPEVIALPVPPLETPSGILFEVPTVRLVEGLEAATAPTGFAVSSPAEWNTPETAASTALSDQDIDRIARRVAELLSDKAVRDIAWEVIPDVAEIVIRDRIRELESRVDGAVDGAGV